jgi:transposase
MGRAGGQHEIVVGDAHRADLHAPLFDGADLGHQHRRVLLLAENVADRSSHVGRRGCRGRDLVEQRLEAMVVLPVDHCYLDRRVAQRFRGFDAAETRADDDDFRPLAGLT